VFIKSGRFDRLSLNLGTDPDGQDEITIVGDGDDFTAISTSRRDPLSTATKKGGDDMRDSRFHCHVNLDRA